MAARRSQTNAQPVPPSIQRQLQGGGVQMGHARALLGTPDRAFQEQLARRVAGIDQVDGLQLLRPPQWSIVSVAPLLGVHAHERHLQGKRVALGKIQHILAQIAVWRCE